MDTLDKAIADTASAATDVVKVAAKVAETTIKKAWTLIDAASQKQAPSEYLSQTAIHSIQGKPPTG